VASVTVTVTWTGMRSQTSPGTSDTLLTARDLQTNKNTGTIAVTVLGVDGSGRSGVRAQSAGTSAVTNGQGRAVLINVPVGMQTVGIERPGYVDEKQDPSPKKETLVSAGECSEVQFQYDETIRATVYYAANYIVDYSQRPYGLLPGWSTAPTNPRPTAITHSRAFASLQATFSNPNIGDYQAILPATNTMVGSLDLHPFASGYTVYAGECDTANPTYWGAPALSPFVTTPGGETSVYVPMGIVFLDPRGGNPNEVVAQPVDPVTNDKLTAANMKGCSALQYTFGGAEGYRIGEVVAIALPYGAWTLTYNDGVSVTGTVPESWLMPQDLPPYPDRGLPAVQTTTTKKQGDVIITVKPRVP
jgi:hypothetical protein